MKKVAATSGQSVSLAMDLFAVGSARAGYWAGSDIELNFYSRPPKGTTLSRCGEAGSHFENTRVLSACKRKMQERESFFMLANRTFVLGEAFHLRHGASAAPFLFRARSVALQTSC